MRHKTSGSAIRFNPMDPMSMPSTSHTFPRFRGSPGRLALALAWGCSKSPPPPLAQPAREVAKKKMLDTAGWSDAETEAVTIGDFRVRVTGARIGSAVVEMDMKTAPLPDPVLVIYLEIANVSADKVQSPYEWARDNPEAPPSRVPKLKDDSGNCLQRRTVGAGRVDDISTTIGSLEPGKAARDVALFDPPADSASVLYLQLPMSADPMKRGTYHFMIPARMVKR